MASTIKSGSNNDLYIQTDGVDRIVVDSNGNTSIIGSVLSVENATGWGEAHLNGANGGDLILQDDGVNIGEVYAGVGHGMTVKSFAGHGINFITNNDTSKMTIDTAGRVTMPYQPHARASRNLGTISGNTVVVFNNADQNVAGMYNTANGRFTAPVAGRYLFCHGLFSVSGYTAWVAFRVNGVNIATTYSNVTSGYSSVAGSMILTMNVNDYADLYVNGASYAIYGGDRYQCWATFTLIG